MIVDHILTIPAKLVPILPDPMTPAVLAFSQVFKGKKGHGDGKTEKERNGEGDTVTRLLKIGATAWESLTPPPNVQG